MSNVENIKNTLAFPFSLLKSIEAAKADGTVNLADIVHFIEPLTKLAPAIEAVKQVKDELTDLTPEEKAELESWVTTTFDLANDSLEEKIETGLKVVFYLAQLYTEFKK